MIEKIMIIFTVLVIFPLFAIGITDSVFADDRTCKKDSICLKSGDFLKYEMTGVPESLYSFNEFVDYNKIKFSISVSDGSESSYEELFLLDVTNGDTFQISNPDEKYSSLAFILPIPLQTDSKNFCKNTMIQENINSQNVMICETSSEEGESKLTFDKNTGIMLEMIIKSKNETSDQYIKLLESNIFEDKIIFESEQESSIPSWVKNIFVWMVKTKFLKMSYLMPSNI